MMFVFEGQIREKPDNSENHIFPDYREFSDSADGNEHHISMNIFLVNSRYQENSKFDISDCHAITLSKKRLKTSKINSTLGWSIFPLFSKSKSLSVENLLKGVKMR